MGFNIWKALGVQKVSDQANKDLASAAKAGDIYSRLMNKAFTSISAQASLQADDKNAFTLALNIAAAENSFLISAGRVKQMTGRDILVEWLFDGNLDPLKTERQALVSAVTIGEAYLTGGQTSDTQGPNIKP